MINNISISRTQNKPITFTTVISKIGKALFDMTFLGPLFELLSDLRGERSFKLNTYYKNLSPLVKQRLQETQQRVRAIAKKAGIVHPERFKIVPGNTLGAVGKGTLVIPPPQLMKKEELPPDVQRCAIFLKDHFVPHKKESYSSSWLKLALDNSSKEMFEAGIGHELGHCVLRHSQRKSWVRFGWRLLSLPTFGISTLFEKRMMQKLSRKHEKEADLFSAKKLNGAAGIIAFFSKRLEEGKERYKQYPEKYDAKGNYLADKDHPHLTQRIAYLQTYVHP